MCAKSKNDVPRIIAEGKNEKNKDGKRGFSFPDKNKIPPPPPPPPPQQKPKD